MIKWRVSDWGFHNFGKFENYQFCDCGLSDTAASGLYVSFRFWYQIKDFVRRFNFGFFDVTRTTKRITLVIVGLFDGSSD